MKKWFAVLLAVLLCVVPVMGVHAEGEFTETARVQNDATVELTYTLPEGKELVEVIIGGAVCPFVSKTETSATIDLLPLSAGVYRDITYAYGNPSEPETKRVSGTPIIVAGRLIVTLTTEFTADGRLTVTATDENELPVEGYQLVLTLDGMPDSGKTDKNGTYTTIYTVPMGRKATVMGQETAYQNSRLIYNMVEMITLTRGEEEQPAGATTTTTTGSVVSDPKSSSATTTTTTATTTAPNVTVWGEGTTAEDGDLVAMNVTTDSAMLEAFGMSKNDFAAKMRFLLDADDYKAILDGKTRSLMLNIKTSPIPPTEEQIQMLFAGVSEYALYDESERQSVTFDLSLLCLSKTGNVVKPTTVPEGIVYTVRMAVPNQMKDCDAFVITLKDGDGLAAPQKVDVKNGMFELKLTSLESYTLIGLVEDSTGKAGGFSWYLTVFLIVGLLLIGAAVLLFIFVVMRKPKAQPVAAQTTAEDTNTDIYSGRPDVWKPEDN